MEAAVSAYSVNSKWWLGFGRRHMGVFGSSKQSLLLSSIGSNWSSRKRINNMNCMRRFRLESTSMGMGPRATIERRQSFKGRFVRVEAASALGGDVENGDVMLPPASIRISAQNVREVAYALGIEDVEDGDVILPQAFVDVAMQYVREGASALGGEDVENGNVMLPHASIDVALRYVLPACVGHGGVMFGFGYYLGSKITNVIVKAIVMLGICVAITLMEQLKGLEHSRGRNPSTLTDVSLTSVLQYVGFTCLSFVISMFGLGCFLSQLCIGGITSAVRNVAIFICVSIVFCWFKDNLSFPLGNRKV